MSERSQKNEGLSDPIMRINDPVRYLALHLAASGAVGTLEDRLAYSLDRCGLLLVTEQKLTQLTRAAANTPSPARETR